MGKLSDTLLRHPTGNDIVRYLALVRGLPHEKLQKICEDARVKFSEKFASPLEADCPLQERGRFNLPTEMQLYSEDPAGYVSSLMSTHNFTLPQGADKGFSMEVYAAIAMRYLKQLDPCGRDTRKILAA